MKTCVSRHTLRVPPVPLLKGELPDFWNSFISPNAHTISRQNFREAVSLPDDAWARARGWALWKALITMTEAESSQYETQADTLVELLEEPVG